jgi:serine/threonine protein kinase
MARGKQSARDLKNPFTRGSILSVGQLRHYRIIKRVGRGSYGSVYKVEKQGEVMALKLVNLREATHDEFVMECHITKLASQLKAGPTYSDSWRIAKGKVGVIVTDLWDMSLEKFMDTSGLKTVPKVVVDKIQGQLDRIHAHGVSHLDLHAGNILVRLNSKGKVSDATLTDFGQAMRTQQVDSETLQDIIDHFELPKRATASEVDVRLFKQIKREWK